MFAQRASICSRAHVFRLYIIPFSTLVVVMVNFAIGEFDRMPRSYLRHGDFLMLTNLNGLSRIMWLMMVIAK